MDVLRLSLAVSIALAPAAGVAQEVRLHVPADTVRIGAHFEMALVVERDAQTQPLFPEPNQGRFDQAGGITVGDVELVHLRERGSRTVGASRADSVVYVAAAFGVESAQLGPIAIQMVVGGDTSVVYSPMARIPLHAEARPGETHLHGVIPAASFPRTVWPWLLGATVLIAAAAWGYRRLAASRGAGRAMRLAPSPARAVVQHIDRLEAARGDRLADELIALAEALRHYVGAACGVSATEMTTAELLSALGPIQTRLSDRLPERLSDVLTHGDLAKFAGFQPGRPDCARVASVARLVVAEVETASLDAYFTRAGDQHQPP